MFSPMDVYLQSQTKQIAEMGPGPEREDALRDLLDFYGEYACVEALKDQLSPATIPFITVPEVHLSNVHLPGPVVNADWNFPKSAELKVPNLSVR